LKKDPDNVSALEQLGLVREGKKDWQGAKEIWQQLSKNKDEAVQKFAQERLQTVEKELKQ